LFEGSVATGASVVRLSQLVDESSVSQNLVNPPRSSTPNNLEPAGDHSTGPSNSGSLDSDTTSETASRTGEQTERDGPQPQDNLESDSSDSEISPQRKKRKKSRSAGGDKPKASTPRSAGLIIANSLAQLVQNHGQSNKDLSAGNRSDHSYIGKAMEILTRCYMAVLSPHEMAVAFDVLSDPKKAYLFTIMPEADARDEWVTRQIAIAEGPAILPMNTSSLFPL
jgi:hypothetical protein